MSEWGILARILARFAVKPSRRVTSREIPRDLESTLHPDPDYRERRRAALPRERRERFDQIVREFAR